MELLALEEQYFNGLVSFDDVLEAYELVEAERTLDFDYWLARARFFAAGCLREFSAGQIATESHQVIVEHYVTWMDGAIERYAGNATPLRMEKEQTIGDIDNAFVGPRFHEEVVNDVEAYESKPRKKVIQSVHDEDFEEETEHATETMGALSKKKLMILIGGAVGFVILLSVILFTCNHRGSGDDYDVESYEVFLQLSHLVELLEDGSTRRDVRNFDLNFVNPDERDLPLRVTAPTAVNLGTIVFYFDDNDVLVRIEIRNANYFNGVAGTEGLHEDIIAGYNVDILVAESSVLNFEIADFTAIITYRNNRFNIDISSDGAGAVEESDLDEYQQAIWDQIEDRLAAGYTSWSQLIQWAISNNIPFDAEENGQRPLSTIRTLIDRYGLIGVYIGAEPGIGTIDDPDAVLLILNFQGLTYNSAIAQLLSLNETSERALETWLEAGGRQMLEREFEHVRIHDIEYGTNYRITTMPSATEAEVEFVRWELVRFDHFTPTGEGELLIERVYRITEIEDEEPEDYENCGPLGCPGWPSDGGPGGPGSNLPVGWAFVPGWDAVYSTTDSNSQNCLNMVASWRWVHTGELNPQMPIWTCVED